MAENSKIGWTDHTFNPWIGCQKISPACDNCYAEAQNNFRKWNRAGWGPHAPRKRTSVANWRKPLQWNRQAEDEGRRYRVFCASLADVFDNHDSITSGWHGDLWALIEQTPNLDWLLLTKRPQNIKKMLPETYGMPEWGEGWPNVWIGTTVENQDEANRRIPILLATPAAMRFVSCEPLLGPVDLTFLLKRKVLNPYEILTNKMLDEGWSFEGGSGDHPGLDWVITGGESGPGARPSHPDWFRAMRDQCSAAGVPLFFKQWGEWAPQQVIQDLGDDEQAVRIQKEHHWGPPHRQFARMHYFDGEESMMHIGKKKAGNTLDGVQHLEFPEVLR